MTSVELETLADAVVDGVDDRLANRRRLLPRHELDRVIGVSVALLVKMMRNDESPVGCCGCKGLCVPYAVMTLIVDCMRVMRLQCGRPPPAAFVAD
ncbi:hypothetical protein [Novipirellula rosea]|uniref:hypothetical protein n=1 Tax=Novipirellula rosea TaxID=1031540 RepID=UPI0031E57B5D